MRKISWNGKHSEIFEELIASLNSLKLKYFILRNYHGLPHFNDSKDVDIIIEPGTYRVAQKILSNILRKRNINYRVVRYEKVRCWYGYNSQVEFSIHLDLIEGYSNKGFEIFSFTELYKHTSQYRSFRVLEPAYDIIMLLYYKVIGTKQLEEKYREYITSNYRTYKTSIDSIINRTIDKELAAVVIKGLESQNYEAIVKYANNISNSSKKNAFIKGPMKTISGIISFIWDKFERVILCPRKYQNLIAVEGADGTGKSTFIDGLINEIGFYYNSDSNKARVYHFRPTVLPNLGAVGEKAGVMKEDKDFTNPHRRKPAGKISSFIRMVYYWLDYFIGVPYIIRKNSRFDHFTIFDRYIYDFLVDPHRSRINLPYSIRSLLSRLVVQPRVVFVLLAEADTIYKRKQELTPDEIKRQLIEFEKLSNSHRRFHVIDANKTPEMMLKQAIEIILTEFSDE